ncbi:polysaccharide lyase family 8 super-sandwich domain-containing protein [Paenibacillus sp. MSJ-34]|uniref:polysaccharide lyase family 8 super-sandwich domain-containing protein n=1 Tax=Paenibacillus sp. MSJ-34 TaxID=2841529 RepID=UPI001C127C2B|nr:polysaccharide lyase family 8 super-sandwich domain-containing protein [Paenibacillus sp. MSJ-34]MBU5444743.1 DNRLRE domain-containing protein [Paenibacillus sp. MSJ-34]
MKALYKRISVVLLFCMTLNVLPAFPAWLANAAEAEAGAAEVNLVPNGGFENVGYTGNASWVDGIQPQGWGAWLAKGQGRVSVTDTVYYSGTYAVQIEHLGADDRTGLSLDVPIAGGNTYEFSAQIKTADVVSSGGVFVRTNFYKSIAGLDGSTKSEKVGDGPSTAKLAGTNDWTLKEAVLAAPAEAKYVRIEPFFETGTGTAWFDDVTLKPRQGITALSLEPKMISLEKGQSATLTPIFTPEDASDQPVVWSSSDSEIASVEGGTVTALDYGTAIITVSTPDGLVSAQSYVTVESSETLSGYDELRLRWYDKLIGGSSMDASDPDVAAYIQSLSEKVSNAEGTGIWDRMNKTPDANALWDDVIDKTNADSARITKAYGMIKDMALAYSTEGTAVYQKGELRNDILVALEWMHTYQYNLNKNSVPNWWDWEIGTPQAFMDILVLMYEEMPAEQVDQYLNVIDRFVPDPTKRVQNAGVTETGANLLDKALVVVLRGVVGKHGAKIEQGRNAMSGEFQYAKSGDGIYEDGSLIQHTNIAYTGAYGGVLIGRMADLMYLFNASPWELDDPNANNVYRWVDDSFEALIYKGAMMDMVKGRSISRQTDSDHLTGRAIIRTLARLAEGAPAEEAVKIKSMIKEWVLSDTTFPNYYDNMPIYEMNLIKAIMRDAANQPRGELVKHQNFAAMDRVVHLRPGFGFGLSMFSDRISAFEFGNNENRKGWYTGIGMTALYNNDLSQYSNQYWPTVDMYRLPGTTTDGYAPAPKDWASYYNAKTWVGGSSIDGQYGAAGMNFALDKSIGSKLHGKKSWFMFDDEIVALGSDIASTDNRKVETIVENRQLTDSGTNKLTLDGQVKSDALGWEEPMKGIGWAHLEGNVAGSDIGYYFPDKADITGKREARTGAWSEINNGGSSDPITRNYLSLAFDHGMAPQNGGYAYVLLPNKDTAATEQYSEHPDIEIVSRTSKVHAVHEKKLGMTAFNFWEADRTAFVRAYQPASIMVKEQGDQLTVAVSDPTQKQEKVTLDLGKAVLKEIAKDPSVTVIQTSPYLKLEIDTKGAIGKTHTIQFQYDPSQTPELDDPAEPGQEEKVTVYVAEDAYVNAGSKAGQNFGGVGYLNVKNGVNDYLRKTFLKYDLSKLSGEIESVKLHVYGKKSDSRGVTETVGAYEVESNAWTENTLIWNNMPQVGSLIEKVSFDSENQWREFDITAYAKARMAADRQVSIALQGETDLTVEVRSKENEGGVYKSYLEVTLKPAVRVMGVQLSKEQAALIVGDSLNLEATVVPENATNANVVWTIDRSDIAALKTDGRQATVTALTPGRVRVTVTTEDGAFTAACVIHITLTNTVGDLNGDGKVGVGDLAMAAAHFGKTAASPDWDKVMAADINGNGIIDADDLQWFAETMIAE